VECTGDSQCTSAPNACYAGQCQAGTCSYASVGGAACVDEGTPVGAVWVPEDDDSAFYSPTVLADPYGNFDMWAGGWLNQAGATVGLDMIFYASSPDLATWTFQSTPAIADDGAGNYFHYNDPSVVTIDYQGTTLFLMYMTGCQFNPSSPMQFNPSCETANGNNTYVSTSFGTANGQAWAWSAPIAVQGLSGAPGNGGPAPTESWSPSALKIADDLVYVYFNDATGAVFRGTIDPQLSFQKATDLLSVSTPPDPSPWTSQGTFHANVDVSQTPDGTYEMLYNVFLPCGGAGNNCSSIARLYSPDGVTFQDDPWFPDVTAYSGSPPFSAWTPTVYRTDPSNYWLYFGWSCEGSVAKCTSDGQMGNAIGMQEWTFAEQQPR
jgi:hypothetical protein